ncbi:ribosomal protein S18 acetylase RimI-like enzyme [Nocardia tenerifensis]|uniref:Ribosomal protein S18 acetylase RimI-like enzyme n=1 Tax=Nocardia tenerifensis TaxID=228006 RepID=A0A318KAY4_9NOCA|nr:GNAT family N-acetyltransferase [Nocardia tenerifensis]PXX71508.1 ribosomal protein S18 acetylase RimI-like enzyme [Nocardia tenerifensis]
MIIQPLRQQMIPELIALMQWGAPYITPRTHSDYWLYAHLFSSTCPVATLDGRLVGATTAFRSQDDPHEMYIQDVMVHPDHRRRGITKALLAHVRQCAADLGCRRLYLTSEPDNPAAHHTWSALGFRNLPGDNTIGDISIITDFKGPGRSRAVYELTLERDL